MATQIAQIRRDLADDFDFDLLLGGINVASTRPFSDAGRARLVQLWRTVAQVTSASFGDGPPFGDFVYNSTQACIATEAMREATGQPPFEFLERLQRSFFTDARDITRRELQRELTLLPAHELGRWEVLIDTPRIAARVRDSFATAKSYGTAALPSVVLEVDGARRLIAGGFVDAPTLTGALRAATRRT